MDTPQESFTKIYKTKRWNVGKAKSGIGSTLTGSKLYRKGLIRILEEYNITSMVDCGCGDWHWEQKIQDKLPEYLGIDVVEKLVKANKKKYEDYKTKFVHGDFLDIAQYTGGADLVVVRHVFEHLPTEMIVKFLEKVKSMFKYGLFTSNNHEFETINIKVGKRRGINLEIEPFNMTDKIDRFVDVVNIRAFKAGGGEIGLYSYLYQFKKDES